MSERIDPTIVFSEETLFLPPLVGRATVIMSVALSIIVMYVLSSVKVPSNDIPIIAFVLVWDVIVCSVLACTKKRVQVGDSGVTMRAYPLKLVNRSVPFDQVVGCEAQAVTCGSCRQRVQLQLSSGESVLIGSQKAEELVAAIRVRIK